MNLFSAASKGCATLAEDPPRILMGDTLENVARQVAEFPSEDTSVIAARVGACATSAHQTVFVAIQNTGGAGFSLCFSMPAISNS